MWALSMPAKGRFPARVLERISTAGRPVAEMRSAISRVKVRVRIPSPSQCRSHAGGAETVDTLYPFYRLIEGGFQPVVAAPEKRKYQMVLHEVKPGWTITREWEGYTIDADIAFQDIQPEDYAGIFFSGGRAPEYIREDEDLLRI